MKKIIVKTTLATLLAVFSILLIILGTLSLTSPQAMEKLASNLGLKQTEATYALQVYRKDKKIDSLAVAVQKNYNVQQYKNVAEYGYILITDSNFDNYCQSQSSIANTSFSTKTFYQAITAEAFYHIGQEEQTYTIAQRTYVAGDTAKQVVDWLLGVPEIHANTNFYNRLQSIKTTTF